MTEKTEDLSQYVLTETIKNNLRKAIAFSKSYNIDVNSKEVEFANALLNKSVTKADVIRMFQSSMLLKEKMLNKQRTSKVTSDTIKWYASGGLAGFNYSARIMKEIGLYKTDEVKDKTEDKVFGVNTKIIKSVNNELKQALYVVLEPDVVDAHLDTYDENEVRKACENFNNSLAQANLFHMVMTDTFEVIESYIAPVDMVFDTTLIKKGTWLMKLQFLDDNIWQGVLDGAFSGLSIGAWATVENLEGTSDES